MTIEDYRKMLDDLIELDEGLTRWEENFVDDVSKRNPQTWTPTVCEKIEQIWNKHF